MDSNFGNAVPLRGDQRGVATEMRTRKVQRRNGDTRSFYVSLNPEWLDQLNLAEQGAATVHGQSLGFQPVVVRGPAIIVQPPSVLEDD